MIRIKRMLVTCYRYDSNKPRPNWLGRFLYRMKFCTYPDAHQAWLSEAIRSAAAQHQATPLSLWRTALEQVNPEVISVAPYCMGSVLVDVYNLLDVATDA